MKPVPYKQEKGGWINAFSSEINNTLGYTVKTYRKPTNVSEVLDEGEIQGFKYKIIFCLYHPNAYVTIPKGHPLFGKSYHDMGIKCHGGLSYGPYDESNYDSQTQEVTIGWDYGHLYDYNSETQLDGHKWTIEEIYEEVKSVIDQLVTMQ